MCIYDKINTKYYFMGRDKSMKKCILSSLMFSLCSAFFIDAADAVVASRPHCNYRNYTGDWTWSFANEYLFLSKDAYSNSGPVFECGYHTSGADYCEPDVILYVDTIPSQSVHIGNTEQKYARFFKCISERKNQFWVPTNLEDVERCKNKVIKQNYKKVGSLGRGNNLYLKLFMGVQNIETAGATVYVTTKYDYCYYSSEVIAEKNQNPDLADYEEEQAEETPGSDTSNTGSAAEQNNCSKLGKSYLRATAPLLVYAPESGSYLCNENGEEINVRDLPQCAHDSLDVSKYWYPNVEAVHCAKIIKDNESERCVSACLEKAPADCEDYVADVLAWIRDRKGDIDKDQCPKYTVYANMNICDDDLLNEAETMKSGDWLLKADKICEEKSSKDTIGSEDDTDTDAGDENETPAEDEEEDETDDGKEIETPISKQGMGKVTSDDNSSAKSKKQSGTTGGTKSSGTADKGCDFYSSALVKCNGEDILLGEEKIYIDAKEMKSIDSLKTCEQFNRRYVKDSNVAQKLVDSHKLCPYLIADKQNKEKAEKQKAEEEAKNAEAKRQRDAKEKEINGARDRLQSVFNKIESDKSVWKNADGSFNTIRLASDLTAGVVLGTVGGVVSGVLIKKSQVEKGFDALHCTVGGQKVADWDDEFSVGLRR